MFARTSDRGEPAKINFCRLRTDSVENSPNSSPDGASRDRTFAGNCIALSIGLLGLVPGGGIEPPRAEARRILSPLRLPVPPSRRLKESKIYDDRAANSCRFVHDSFISAP